MFSYDASLYAVVMVLMIYCYNVLAFYKVHWTLIARDMAASRPKTLDTPLAVYGGISRFLIIQSIPMPDEILFVKVIRCTR